MTATMQSRTAPVERAIYPRPQHVGGVARALAGLLGLSPKHAERRLSEARKIVDRVVEAARRAGKPEYVADFFSHADSARKIDGAPLPVDANFACLINRDVLAESQCLAEFLADRTHDERAALLKHSKKLATEVAELIAGLES